MPELILHIGCEKTGSTSLQNYFAANRDAFFDCGVCYPHSLGATNHVKLAVAAISHDNWAMYIRHICGVSSSSELETFRESLSRELKDEISGFNKVIISSEHLAAAVLSKGDLRWLQEFLSAMFDSIRVIVYLRRQDQFHTSLYSTQVRLGARHKLSYPRDELIETKYNYKGLLERWASIFPGIEVRRYGAEWLLGGNVVDDFLDLAGLERPREEVSKVSENGALGADQLEFLRNVNRFLLFRVDGKISPKRGFIDRAIDSIPQSGGRLGMPRAAAIKLMEAVRDSNRWVAERFFNQAFDSGDPLFGDLNLEESMECRPLDLASAASNATAMMKQAGAKWDVSEVDLIYQMFALWWEKNCST